jgi:helicase MOV-10
MPQWAWTAHVAGARHRNKEVFFVFRSALDEAEKDKHGITISTNTDFGFVEVDKAEGGFSTSLKVENTTPGTRIRIKEVKLASQSTRIIGHLGKQ